MQLTFVRGNAQTPRGHAIVIVRPYGKPDQALATYCIVLPITFSLGRYLPPILSAQLPLEGLREMGGSPSVMPVPPMLEDVADVDALIALAEMRDDDVVEISGVDLSNEGRRMELAAETCNEYGQLYVRYTSSHPAKPKAHEPEPALPDSIRAVLADAVASNGVEHADEPLNGGGNLTDREQLSEIARLIGTLRYALDGHDERQVEETKRALRRASAMLSPKFRADDLIEAVVTPGATGQKLAELYLTRAYRLVDEDYPAIPPIEQQIKELTDHAGE